MLGKCVTQQDREIVLREMGRASCASGDVEIVAFVMPLDALARLGFESQGRDGRTTNTRYQHDDGRDRECESNSSMEAREVFAPEAKNR
jgi:hypothetical protein